MVDRGEVTKITQNGFHESKKSVDAEQVALVIFNSIALITPTTPTYETIWHAKMASNGLPNINTNKKYTHTLFGWL